MLDGILGRGFSVKSKSLIKTTRSRIEVVRKRADVKQRFLREDLAKLLSNGLDINAYGRTEEYIAGMNLLFCYDFVEQCCECMVKQLSRMQKQDECPEECREAVACLMYAAARFSDLPELRQLRDIFEQRYGNSCEAFLNQKFVEKLSSKSPTSEKRLRVLQDVASEFSIKWDSRGFERRMAAPSVAAQVALQKVDIPKQKLGLSEESKSRMHDGGADNISRYGESHHRPSSRRKEVLEYKEKPTSTSDRIDHKPSSYPIEKSDSQLKVTAQKPDVAKRKPGLSDDRKSQIHDSGADNISRFDEAHHRSSRRNEALEYKEKSASTRDKTHHKPSYPTEKSDSNDSSSVRHLNGGESKKDAPFREKLEPAPTRPEPSGRTENGIPGYALPPPPYVKPKEHNLNGHVKDDRHLNGRVSEHDRVIEPNSNHEKDPHVIPPLRKPRPIRKKHSRLPTGSNDGEEQHNGARRTEHSRKGLQLLFDGGRHREDDDNEERKIDKLLMHYSMKPQSYKPDMKNSGKKRSPRKPNSESGESSTAAHPTRSVSLTHKQHRPASPQPENNVFNRAKTLEPDRNLANHVHPRLPDYNDLAARFAALKEM